MWDRLREDISCVFERDPAARTRFEVLTTYPGIHALLLHRVSHALSRNGLPWLARILANIARWYTGIEIHPGARIGRRFFIDHGMGVVIGETAEIGDDCTMYHGVTLGGTSWKKGKRHPTLENNVVIGAGAKILGPITISEGGRVGSNAVVVKDVPPGGTVVGVPGHVVQASRSEIDKHREAFAKKIGFDAYGSSSDMPDPVAHAVNCLLDHIHAMDKKIDKISIEFNKIGGNIDVTPLPDLDIYDVDSIDNTVKKEENAKVLGPKHDNNS